jgi:site-specific DNA-methyltransferase (adenine-specific)
MSQFPQVKLTKVSGLIPYARNARTHSDDQVKQIAASIREFGFNNPILIRDDLTVIAGHGRLAAAKVLGLEDVPTISLSHLSPIQVRAYILADNKLAMNAGWDDEMLSLELKELEMEGFDVSLTGFDELEVEAMLLEKTEDGLTDEDDVPEENMITVTKKGDVWNLGKHRVMCGDSTVIDDFNKLMAGGLADLLHTDPPYGVDYEGVNNDHLKADKLRFFIKDALTNCFLSMKEGSNAYVWHPDIHAYEFIGAFRDSGFTQAKPSTIQWLKSSLVLSQGDYHSINEPCLYGWKEGSGRVRVKDRTQTTVWSFDKPKRSKDHPTMKPVELCERAINNSSLPGHVVLDAFGGSGSTLIACEKTGRINRSMELDPKYCDVIVRRWQDFTGKKAVLESSGKTFNELCPHEDSNQA